MQVLSDLDGLLRGKAATVEAMRLILAYVRIV